MAAAGWIVGAVGKEALGVVLEKIFGHKKNGNGNGQVAINAAVEHTKTLSILEQHTDILRSLAASNDKIKDGITELVAVTRERRP